MVTTIRYRAAWILILFGGMVWSAVTGGTAMADVFSNVPEAAGYQLVYTLPIPGAAAFKNTTPVPYSVNNAASVGSFDRVAYYMELDNGSGLRWVYASMDAFEPVASRIGLPHNVDNPVIHRQVVSNMNVSASSGVNVTPGTGIQTGYLEMWPSNYGGNVGPLIPTGGSDFDWNDTGGDIVAGHGSFQIHNYDVDGAGPGTAGQTVFGYNNWGGNGGNSDLGIGTNTDLTNNKRPDWTFSSSAPTYTVKNLQVLARPATSTIVQTNSQDNASATAFDSQISKFDLGNSNQKNFLTVTAMPDTSNTSAFPRTNLNNGDSGMAYWNEDRLAAVVTYEFNTAAKPNGYDITGINSFAGYPGSNGATQANQGYQLLVRKVGSSTFEHVGVFHNSPYTSANSVNASTKISLTDPSGVIASGVDAVRFVLIDHGQNYHATNAGSVYREIDLFGTPTGNLIKNPSFETPALPGPAESYYYTANPFDTNWAVSGEVTLVRDRWGAADDGAQWLSLESNRVGQPNNVGSVSQTFATMPNHHYLLSFDYSALQQSGDSRTWTFTYDVGQGPLPVQVGGIAGANALLPWQTFTYEFTANAATTTLTFRGNNLLGGYWGPAIDNVGVFLRVPEPSTWLLASLGLLGLAILRRRR
jgi:hypothetical protein